MKWLERIVVATFPTLLLESTPWRQEWADKERDESLVLWRIVLPLVAAIYFGHLFFFDRPMGLRPGALWTEFRLSVAAMCLASFLFYCIPMLFNSLLYRLPISSVCWLLCYTQAETVLWYDNSQYLYA